MTRSCGFTFNKNIFTFFGLLLFIVHGNDFSYMHPTLNSRVQNISQLFSHTNALPGLAVCQQSVTSMGCLISLKMMELATAALDFNLSHVILIYTIYKIAGRKRLYHKKWIAQSLKYVYMSAHSNVPNHFLYLFQESGHCITYPNRRHMCA